MSDNDAGSTGPGGWEPPPPPPPPPTYGQSDPPPYSSPSYGQPPYGEQQPQYGQPPYGQQPAYGAQQYGQPPYYGYQPYGPPPKTEGSAVGALVASIISWMICPIIPAIVALVMIPGAKRKIDGSGGRLTGDGLLTAAKWISWINIALWGLMIVGFGILIAIGASTSSDTSTDFSLGVVARTG